MDSKKEGNIASNSKFIGVVGIFAALIFLFGTLAASFSCSGFELGVDSIRDLGGEVIFIFTAIMAGALLVIFGVGVLIRNMKSDNMPGILFGLLIAISGVMLAVVGGTEANQYVIWVFVVVMILAALAEIWYEWITQQYVFLVIAVMLVCIMAATAGTDAILGFGFFIFAMIWIIYESALFLLPEVEVEPVKAKKGKETKKNEPKARPYPAATATATKPVADAKKTKTTKGTSKPASKQEPVAEKKVAPAPVVVPKKKSKAEKQKKATVKEETKPVAEEVPAEKEVKAEVPVAAVVAEEVTPIVEEAPTEKEVEVVAEPVEAPVAVDEPVEEVSETEEEYDIVEDTPSALVRRVTWNHGLRCRRDYGEYQIPIAFVKAKVAVYILPEVGDTSVDEELKADGWMVLRYLEGDITDGKKEGDEIAAVAKANLKALKAASKVKASKK